MSPGASPWMAAVAVALAAVLMGRPSLFRGPGRTSAPSDKVALVRRLRPLLAPLAGLGALIFVGGASGWLLGAGAATYCWRVLGRAEPPALARHREGLRRDLPGAVDLVASCLLVGSTLQAALTAVGDAVGGPVAEELATVVAGLALGMESPDAWARADPALWPLGRALHRGEASGARVSDTVARMAEDLRAEHRTRVLARGNSVEVRASAPLVICFLPAFVLVGVVPLLVAGMSGLRTFW